MKTIKADRNNVILRYLILDVSTNGKCFIIFANLSA